MNERDTAQPEMAQPVEVLLVEDNPADVRLIQEVFKEGTLGAKVALAGDGQEALEQLGRARALPHVILTDLQMPRMDGLELVRAVRKSYPTVPVVLMTAYGSDEVAVQALHEGAVHYVPKKTLHADLVGTLEGVLEAAQGARQRHNLLACLMTTASYFLLDNSLALIAPLIAHLQENLKRMKLCDETVQIQVAVALREALVNAIFHGNLEASSSLREQDDRDFYRLAERRCHLEPYRLRRVHVKAEESRAQAVYVVRDEGPGFDLTTVPDPTDPANLERASGRGLLLIRTFMDEVHHNEFGNEITMIWRPA